MLNSKRYDLSPGDITFSGNYYKFPAKFISKHELNIDGKNRGRARSKIQRFISNRYGYSRASAELSQQAKSVG